MFLLRFVTFYTSYVNVFTYSSSTSDWSMPFYARCVCILIPSMQIPLFFFENNGSHVTLSRSAIICYVRDTQESWLGGQSFYVCIRHVQIVGVQKRHFIRNSSKKWKPGN